MQKEKKFVCIKQHRFDLHEAISKVQQLDTEFSKPDMSVPDKEIRQLENYFP